MNERDQIDQISNELDALINRYRLEYDTCYADLIGVLQLKIHTLCNEACAIYDEDKGE